MKMKSVLLLALIVLFTMTHDANAQRFAGLDKSPHDISYFRTSRNAAPIVKVLYGRPQLKGRSIKTLAPHNKVWRTGANEATEVTFYKDVRFGDKSVKAGTYTLFTIPGEKEWTIVLNTDLNVWGAYSYNKGKDAARTTVPVTRGDDALEAFSIAFKAVDNGAHMILGWGTVRVAVPVATK